MTRVNDREPPRISLAQLPTPVVELKHVARDIGAETILMKRDDLTGLEVSGNKVRKLAEPAAAALAKACDTLVTRGGLQSNHCRARGTIGARLGLRMRLRSAASVTHPPN